MNIIKATAFVIFVASTIFAIAVALQFVISHAYALIINADSIHCNWLWCDVKKTISVVEHDCYMNGEPVNCSLIT